MFKKVIYLGLMAGAIHFADAQKINLGKTRCRCKRSKSIDFL